ncbi:MAG: DNA-3-methyladenine glycosylase [Ruminococcus sp.]|nr:DNA-3-methyladenine glycosylase [Ruminococcus sp.]MDD7670802.1 DNA-3-methyladenine glycosylase [Ruminococcus sp.]MDY2742550.1 DNA-3-methyladenine glycosylase [Eubacteriales bacterium]CDD03188.1 8-oxoguanine DNA glycosylase domain-containing protein [Ruminococcus sp. CAG:382]
MDISFSNGNTYISRDGLFEPSKTFDCGQCFRFERCEGGWQGIAMGRLLMVLDGGDMIALVGVDEPEYRRIWESYFDLDRDYGEINAALSRDAVVRNALNSAKGIRILRQDRWETLCSFIISQNNNIPRIKGIIGRLCEAFGDRIDGGYAFPSADRIASLTEEQLAPIRSGFRARYILDAARRVTDGSTDLDAVSAMSYDDAKKYLMQIKGVGNKVADCVLLFGYGFFDAFPKDVWIKRVIEKYYGENFDESIFKPYGGIAQQYLFYSERGF